MASFPPVGAHLKVSRGPYAHHGISTGDGDVIHYSGEVGRKENARVQVNSLRTFAAGGRVRVVQYASRYPGELAVARAKSRLGEASYNLVFQNCEHFARWCCTGEHSSEQVVDAAAGAGVTAGTAAATGAALGTVSVAGAVAGLSGPGIMSGLATVGGVAGAGAVGGLVILASAPAAIGTVAMRTVLKDDSALPAEERSARTAGRVGAAAGGVVGTAGSIAAVSAMGSVAGLSGAGITSGLAALGAGSMVAGTGLAVAAPAVAAVAVGYGVYRLARWFID